MRSSDLVDEDPKRSKKLVLLLRRLLSQNWKNQLLKVKMPLLPLKAKPRLQQLKPQQKKQNLLKPRQKKSLLKMRKRKKSLNKANFEFTQLGYQ